MTIEEEQAAEIERLEADTNSLRADNEKLRKAIEDTTVVLEISCEALESPTYKYLEVGFRHNPLSQKETIERFTETCSFVRADLLRTIDAARAALEGMTEKSGDKNDRHR